MDPIALFEGARHVWNDVAPLLLAVLVALTALVQALRVLARWCLEKATTTPAEWDDHAAERAVRVLEAVGVWLDRAQAWAPRIGLGDRQRPATGGRR